MVVLYRADDPFLLALLSSRRLVLTSPANASGDDCRKSGAGARDPSQDEGGERRGEGRVAR